MGRYNKKGGVGKIREKKVKEARVEARKTGISCNYFLVPPLRQDELLSSPAKSFREKTKLQRCLKFRK